MESSPTPEDGDAVSSSLAELLDRWRTPLSLLTPYGRSHKSTRDGLRYWWFNVKDDIESLKPSLRSHSETLALLEALQRVDAPPYADQVHEFLSGHALWHRGTAISTPGALPHIQLGFQFSIPSVDDLGPVGERVFAVQAPSRAFVEDYAFLAKLSSGGGDGDSLSVGRGIPVSLRLTVKEGASQVHAHLLRQVLQLVMAQQALTTRDVGGMEDSVALTASRFHIVELRFGWVDPGSMVVTREALEYLAEMCQRGVRIRTLPTIREGDWSVSSQEAVAEALRVLISPSPDSKYERCQPTHVYISGDTSSPMIPIIASAIQTSASVKSVHLRSAHRGPNGLSRDQLAGMRKMWHWTAYALFSHHAQHQVQTVDIDCGILADVGIDRVREMLAVENPLGVLFQTSSDARARSGWLSSSTFYALPTSKNGASHLHQTETALTVRTIESVDRLGEKWWRVLLPGRGEAWVPDREAREHDLPGVLPAPTGHRGFYLKFMDIVESDQIDIASLLPLIHGDVRGIELVDPDETFAVDAWVTQLLSDYPKLQTLILPFEAELNGLGEIVSCAVAGTCQLRHLQVDCVLNVDSAGVVEFLDVLCDETHPLTKSLEVLQLLAVEVRRDAAKDLAQLVQRMLASNRRIHTLTLYTQDSELDVETDDLVAIRSAPLDIRSKLAFLSVVAALPVSAPLDSGVTSIIFSFAAQHRLRKVEIDAADW